MRDEPTQETWWDNCSEQDKIRLRVARLLGFQQIVFRGIQHPRHRDFIGSHKDRYTEIVCIPEYSRDAEVMRGVEEGFNEEQKARYISALRDVMGLVDEKGRGFTLNHWGLFDLAHASAMHRAKAFLYMNGHIVPLATPDAIAKAKGE